MLNRFRRFQRLAIVAACIPVLPISWLGTAAMASVPAVVASSQSTFASIGTDLTKVVVDGSGNLFAVDASVGALYEVPAGTTTPITLIASGLGGTHGLAVDSYGDVIVSAGYGASALYFLPNISGAICTTCGPSGGMLNLVTANGMQPSGVYYFYAQLSDAAVDKSGNVYFSSSSTCNYCTGPTIWKVKTQGPTTSATTLAVANTASVFLSSLPGGKTAQNLAIDASENLYYADNTSVYVVSTTATTPVPVTIGTGFVSPYGVAVDAINNLYVSDNGGSTRFLYVIPNEGGSLNPTDQYRVASPTNIEYGVGFDPAGNIYSAGGYSSTPSSVYKTTLGYVNFGSSNVGVFTPNANVTFSFNASTTPSAIGTFQGTGTATEFTYNYGSCTIGTTFTAGQTCYLNLGFKPSSTGFRRGAVELLSSANKALATGYLAGSGLGAALTIDPGTVGSLTAKSAWNTPSAVALDGSSNLYVADAGAKVVQVISAAGVATATIGSGLSSPGGVAVDAAGNVLIADTGNNRIVEVPNENGTLNTADQTVVVSSGLSFPQGIAVSPSGSVYIADTGNKRVVRLFTFSGLNAAFEQTLGSGFQSPAAVATDSSGNLYVADQTAKSIDEYNITTGVQSIALSGLTAPSGVAIDASESAYVIDNGLVERFTNVGGALQSNSKLSLSTALTTPTGVAVNGAGNVAISDSGAPGAFTLLRSAGSINFGSVNEQLQSSAQLVTLTSAGTAAVTLGATPYVATGSTADFIVASASGTNPSGCTASESLSTGLTCGYSAIFAPVATGPLSETLTFSTNAVNGASFTALLNGNGTNLSLTTTTIAQSTPAPPANPVYGQTVTVTATVVTSRSGYTPTGTVQFYVDGSKYGTAVTLSTAAPYTAQETIAALFLTTGVHSVTASYSGDANNSSSNTTTALLVSVGKEPDATTIFGVSPAIPQAPGSVFAFYVAVSASIGQPTGTVNLVTPGSTATLASATLGTALPSGVTCPAGDFCAPINYSPTTLGQDLFQVVYAGDSNFSSSTSSSVAVSVQNPGYTLTLTPGNLTVIAGQSVVETITVTSISAYAGNVAVGGLNYANGYLSPTQIAPCTGLPVNANCVFSPGQVALTANGTATINLTINTSAPPSVPYPTPGGLILWPGGLGGMLALALAMRRSRGSLRARTASLLLWCLALTGLALGATGCNIGSAAYPTPAGQSTLTLTTTGSPVTGAVVSATNPNISVTTTFQLTVQ